MRALQEVRVKAAMEEWGSGTCMQVAYSGGYIHSCHHPVTHTSTITHLHDMACTNYCELCGNNVSLMLHHALGVLA